MGYIFITGNGEREAATSLNESLDTIDAALWFSKGGWNHHPEKPEIWINKNYPGKEGQFLQELPPDFNKRAVVHILLE